ncbi:MAG: flagellar hook protein FlgE [Thermodesulfobacteriota bacterium]|nr:flagellar hook protein FlgE [Thermodesulfobacteriota bacterium]
MIGSLYAGISGLNANAMAMSVIGDNIANVNTTGFKTSAASFANVLSQSLGGSGGNEIGRGVQFWGTNALWTQGTLENTSSPIDMAIGGKGFFIVQDTTGIDYYTRAGQFTFDRDGYLVNPDGLVVQGFVVNTINPDGTFTLGNIGGINIPGESSSPPQPTTQFTVDINLDAGASSSDTYLSSMTVFDSLGNEIPLTITFTNTGAGAWSAAASIPTSYGSAAFTTDPLPLTFDADGELTAPAADGTIRLTLTNGATSPQDITWDLYDDVGTLYGDITGYASPSVTTFQTQDGYAAGSLRSVSVDDEGVMTGAYSNGQLMPLYQIALADFPSYYGLTKMGENLWAQSRNSGPAMPGLAGNGTLGTISPSSLEMSNVDLASEFVKMITTQRAFQANSRVITTSDEILTELINLKR